MFEEKDTLKFIGLQFFAEEGGEGGEGDPDTSEKGKNEPEDKDPPDDDKGTKDKSEKTLTQEEVNKLVVKEKEKGKKALLKELGLKDVKSAKSGLKDYKKYLDTQKTELQKAQEAARDSNEAKSEAESRAILAEAKVEILTAGGKAEYLDDLMTLVVSRKSDDEEVEDVVEAMKKDKKYALFFGKSDTHEDPGTGGGSGYNRDKGRGGEKSLGARLGALHAKSTKNPYFNN